MTLDYIALGVVVVSIGGILMILARKFPVLASIDTQRIPRHRNLETKADLIESRLYRKFMVYAQRLAQRIRPIFAWLEASRQRLRTWIRELEHRYQVPTAHLSDVGKAERSQQITRLLEEGGELAKNEEYAESEKKYIEVISLDPKNVDAYKGLGELYYMMKDFEHAREVFQHALVLNTKDDAMHARLGNIAAQLGHFEEAQSEYLESVALNSQIADHHIDLGETYVQMHKPLEAFQSFSQAVKIEPNNPRNLDALIEQAIVLKKKDVAIQALRTLSDVNPENQKLKDFQERIDNLQ